MEMAQQPPLSDWCGKIELVEGIITHMSPSGYPHFGYQRRIFIKLHDIFRDGLDGYIVGQELTVHMIQPKQSVRLPDVCIFCDPGNIEGIIKSNALLLAIEVADTSLREDLGPKRLSYARAGVPHYWVMDINAEVTHVMSDPHKGDYRSQAVVPFKSLLAVPGAARRIRIG